ncbi:hypothetical protein GMORB2_7278 [Geosmithia morbida]|uniref:Uncharacterized protein n=1 Tax=Geosmithia morbida TaxID=1094350 RepID=A0A9P4YSG5_9HYPO|nr:uncharacterized protein GMORB2_7278 [Geosmithia morbida]KAF4122286.1 hypothetical protein GMORB2_7278 [Geosmithia morbida]
MAGPSNFPAEAAKKAQVPDGLKCPRYSRRIQSKSEPFQGSQDSDGSDGELSSIYEATEDADAFVPVRRVSAPPMGPQLQPTTPLPQDAAEDGGGGEGKDVEYGDQGKSAVDAAAAAVAAQGSLTLDATERATSTKPVTSPDMDKGSGTTSSNRGHEGRRGGRGWGRSRRGRGGQRKVTNA